MKIKPEANSKICNTPKLLSNTTGTYRVIYISQLASFQQAFQLTIALKISSFSADQAPVVEVKGPTVGGKDVGAGQGLKQQQQHQEVPGGKRH